MTDDTARQDREYERILLILIGRLGDYIATTPFVAGLRRRYPRAHITLITSQKARNLASSNPDIDRLVVFNGWHDPISAFRTFAAAAGKYDLAIDLNPTYSRTSLRLIALRKARTRIAFDKKAPAGTYTRTIPHSPDSEHMLDKYERMASVLDFRPGREMHITLSGGAKRRGAELFRGLGLDEKAFIIAVHPGNFKKQENRWPEEKFVEFTKEALKESGNRVFYIAGPGEESRINETILRFLPGIKLLPTAPEEVLAAALQNADILVCNNTGTLHLAAAAGVPTFSFNRPYTEKCWQPRGEDNFFITASDLKSCRGIEVKDALEAFRGAEAKLKKKRPTG